MAEDLKLFGEVGLGYSSLLKDAEQINKIIGNIDSSVKKLGETFSKNGIHLDTAKSEKALKQQEKAIKEFVSTNKQAQKQVQEIDFYTDKFYKTIGKVTTGAEQLKKEFNSTNLGSGNFKKEAEQMNKDLEKLKNSLNDWVKQKKRLDRDLTNIETSKLTRSNYTNARNSGDKRQEAEAALRMSQAYVVLKEDLRKLTIQEAAYKSQLEEVKRTTKAVTTEQKNLNKVVSDGYLKQNLLKSQDEKFGLGSKESVLKNGIHQITTKYLDEYGTTIQKVFQMSEDGSIKLMSAIKKADPSVPIKRNLKGVQTAFKQTEAEVGRVGNKLDEHFQVKDGKGLFNSARVGYTITQLYLLKRIVTDINNEMASFEQKAIEIQRIAGYTNREMEALKDQTFEMGKNYGLGVDKMQEIEALWARTGKSGKDLIDATKTTALGFNVAEFKDAESAVASINSIVNQMYQGNTQKAPEILDALVKVADKTAVRNVNDLVEVVSRAGATGKELGMSLHDLNASASIVMERMKVSGDVLGTQFKTLFAYMADSRRINALKKFGVEFTTIGKDGVESLKPYSQMMDSLVAKYKELKAQGKDVEANKMVSTLAGFRNIATLKNLMEGWGSFRDRVKLSENSNGFAESQNDKIMESYTKKMQALKVAYQELAVAVGSSGLTDGLKFVMDLVTKGVTAFSHLDKNIIKIISTIGAFKIAIAALTRVETIMGISDPITKFLTMRKDKQAKANYKSGKSAEATYDVAKDATEVSAEATGVFAKMAEGAKNAKEASQATTLFGKSLAGLKGAIAGLDAAMAGMLPMVAGIGVALGALYFAYKKFEVDRQNKLDLISDFSSGKADKAISNIKDLSTQLDKVTKSTGYQEKSKESLEEYRNITNELSSALGVSADYIEGNTESMQAYNAQLREAVKLKTREHELEAQEAKSDAKDLLNDELSGKNYTSPTTGEIKYKSEWGDDIKQLEQYAIKRKILQDELAKTDEKDVSKRRRLNSQLDVVRKDENTKMQDTLKLYQSLVQAKNLTGMSDEEFRNKINESYQMHGDSTVSDVLQNIIDSKGEYEETADDISKANGEMQDSYDKLAQSIEESIKNFNDIESKLNALHSAIDEWDQKGVLSNGTVVSLLEKDPDMVNYIGQTEKGFILLAGAKEHMNEVEKEAVEETKNVINGYREQADMLTDIDGHIVNTTGSFGRLTEKVNALAEATKTSSDDFQVAIGKSKVSVDEFLDKLANADNPKELLQNILPTDIPTLNSNIANQLKTTMEDLNKKFKAGQIDVVSYADGLTKAQDKALKLYTALNNLTLNDKGDWVDAKGKVDDFATSLSNSIEPINSQKTALDGLLGMFEKFPEAINAIDTQGFDLSSVIGDMQGFSTDFTKIMSDLQNSNSTVWDNIVDEVSTKMGITKDAAIKTLTTTKDMSGQNQKVLSIALASMIASLAKSLGLSDDAIGVIVNNISAKLASIDYTIGSNIETNPIALRLPGAKGVESQVVDAFTMKVTSTKGKGGPQNIKVLSKNPNNKEGYANYNKLSLGDKVLFDSQYNYPEEHLKNIQEQNSKKDSLSKSLDAMVKDFNKEMEEAQKKLEAENRHHDTKDGNHNGNGGGSGKGNDIPSRVQDSWDDLKHELEMERITDDEYYKKLTDLYEKNKGSMTKRGKQKFEKALKDAKDKSNNSIPAYVKTLIDDLDDKLKYEEIDQYEYAKQLEKVLGEYKKKISEKGIKEIEKKIKDAKVGGLGKMFQSDISELEYMIKLSDLAVQKIEAEQSLYEALNIGGGSNLVGQAEKLSVLNNKLYATEALSRKYELIVKACNEEIKKLDTTSKSYKSTLEGLVAKQHEMNNKMNEAKIASMELQKRRAEEQMKMYDAIQKQYDDAISAVQDIESRLVNYVNSRNQKIREQAEKNHKAQMDAIEEEEKARDDALNKERKRLQEALDAYQKYIRKKMDMLDRNWETDDYERELAKKVNERDELQNRINSLSLDDSNTAKGKRIELKKQLADKDDEIERMQQERSRKLTKDGLQDQLDEYTENINNKMKKLDEESEHERKLNDDRKKMLEDAHKHEMELMDERMKASAVYAEVKQAILSGYVQDSTGAAITIKEAMIESMREQGQASGILAQVHIANIEAVMAKLQQALQLMGMVNSSAAGGSLQQRLNLTDEGYQQYLGQKAHELGFNSRQDTEKYIMNKMAWGSASGEERKRLEYENHQMRRNQMKAQGLNENDRSHNKDMNGAVLGMDWILDTGTASKMGQRGGQFTPIPGFNDKDEARRLAQADVARMNPYTSQQGSAAFDSILRNNPSAYGRNPNPNMGNWAGQDYYNRYRQQTADFMKMKHSPTSSSDYNAAMDFVNNYTSELENSFNNDSSFPYGDDVRDRSAADRLISEANKQNGMPYSQSSTRTTTHRDCSSYVYFAVKNAGLYNGEVFSTSGEREALGSAGWRDMGQLSAKDIKRGDVLWRVGHTEIATQDGTFNTTGAHREGVPAGASSWNTSKPYRVLRHPSVGGYRYGGIVTDTGVAMLHGSKSAPEYIFNSPQFDALGQLVAKYISLPSLYARTIYDGNGGGGFGTITIENLVNIEGNADMETVTAFKESSDKILDNLVKTLKKNGIRR